MTKTVKGFLSIDSDLAFVYQQLIADFNQIAQRLQFQPVLVPTVETKTFFQKTVGSLSDISQKEFFHCTGSQKNMLDDWVLRPELTTGVVHHLLRTKALSINKPFNFFTSGSCFRYENPQHGRYREFFQWNLEQLNYLSLDQKIGLSLICLQNILDHLAISDQIVVEINYLTNSQLQRIQKIILSQKDAFDFCTNCQKRFVKKNVHLIVDCKKCSHFVLPSLHPNNVLTVSDHDAGKIYYDQFRQFLPKVKIVPKLTLTRGLDYYSGLVFEVKIPNYRWSQSTIIAGGIYPMNVFNNSFLPNRQGFGFAVGVNRLIEFLKESNNSYLTSLVKHKVPDLVLGYLEQYQLNSAMLTLRDLIDHNLKVHFVEKANHFSDLVKISTQQQSVWLVVVDQEYNNQNKVILRQITKEQTTSPTQKLLTLTEVVNTIKKNAK